MTPETVGRTAGRTAGTMVGKTTGQTAWIETVAPGAPEAASGLLGRLYRRHRRPDGLVDHIVVAGSPNPVALEHHLALYEHLMRGESGLSRAEREMIAVAVSVANGCRY